MISNKQTKIISIDQYFLWVNGIPNQMLTDRSFVLESTAAAVFSLIQAPSFCLYLAIEDNFSYLSAFLGPRDL